MRSTISNGMENAHKKMEEVQDSPQTCGNLPEMEIISGSIEQPPAKNFTFLGISIIVAGLIVGASIIAAPKFKQPEGQTTLSTKALATLQKTITPDKGVALPAVWGDLGKQLIDSGAIDQKKFEDLYAQRGGLDDASKNLLTGSDNGKLVITKENSNTLLNLLWALGLANKNEILEKGEMSDPRYGGADKFASTGGWTLAKGNPMQHYSMHAMITLTPEQQRLVDEVSKNIYRPCCGNSTHFPDCNHGMAMLGLLQLMASQGVSESDMYKAALYVNSYWFPDTYLNIAQFLKTKGIDWNKTGAKELLGANFSSSAGYQQILKEIQPATGGGGGGCGV